MDIKIFETERKAILDFKPINSGVVSIYSCGPTVYHYAHVGNLRSFIFADTLNRMFRSQGFKVNHVINITDVGHLVGDGDSGEDKLEKGSRREGKSAFEVARHYEECFKKDLVKLNIPLTNYKFPRATDYIEEQISFVKTLESKGYTYVIEGDGIYFDTSKFPSYHDFAKLPKTGDKVARIAQSEGKRQDEDFALWKFSPVDEKRQMEWQSPWGVGFPGWHIECSAMSCALLGEVIDIHTGGADHPRVHHTNEIAQSECALGHKFVNFWMHNAFLNDKEGKMSKSSDDFMTLDRLVMTGNIMPISYRFFCLQAKYRQELSFTIEAVKASDNAYRKIIKQVSEILSSDEPDDKHDSENSDYDKDVINQIDLCLTNDLDTPKAIAILFEFLKSNISAKISTLKQIDDRLGLEIIKHSIEKLNEISEDLIPENILDLANKRLELKKNKEFKKADEIREEVSRSGFDIIDNGSGFVIKPKEKFS